MQTGHISIWFFIGITLTIYGVLICGSGLVDLAMGITPHVVMAHLHAPVWWGGLMLALGLFYSIRFRPGRNGKH